MNVHSEIRLNETEELLLSTAEQLLATDNGQARSGERATAIEQIRGAGLPTRRRERWHYTDLRSLLTGAGATQLPAPSDGGDVADNLIEIVDGQISIAPSWPTGLAQSGVVGEHSFGHPLDDTVRLVNSALLRDELSLNVTGEHSRPFRCKLAASAGTHAHSRLAIATAVAANATFVFDRCFAANSFASFGLTLNVAARSHLTIVVNASDEAAAKALTHIGGEVGEDAKLTVLILNVGDGFSRTELEFSAIGDRADIGLYGANCLSGSQVSDTTLVIDHRSLASTSKELFKYVGKGRSKGIFQGRINVDSEAQKTDAQMMANALLLSDDAEFLSKPELEIFADDVQCAHGCTAGEMDSEQLFYLMARGIPRPEAEKLLILSFVASVFDTLSDQALIDELLERVVIWLDRENVDG